MDYQFQFRDKIRVGIQGAETEAGQHLATLLAHHPWFQLASVETALTLSAVEADPKIIVANGGPEVSILADVNGYEAMGLPRDGVAVTHPGAAAAALILALKPLQAALGPLQCHAVTLLPVASRRVASLDIIDNVIPLDDQVAQEVQHFVTAGISSQSYRLPVRHGCVQNVCVKFESCPSPADIVESWYSYRSAVEEHRLPSSPPALITYLEGVGQPQPKGLRHGGIVVGSLKRCHGLFDFQFTVVSDPDRCGPVGGAIRNAELLVRSGLIFW